MNLGGIKARIVGQCMLGGGSLGVYGVCLYRHWVLSALGGSSAMSESRH